MEDHHCDCVSCPYRNLFFTASSRRFTAVATMALSLDTPVQYVPRVGPAMAAKLHLLGVKTVEDFLYYAPFRYNDYSLCSPIAAIQVGETVTIKGTVTSIRNIFTKTGKNFQEGVISDASGSISVLWFNQPYLTKVISAGASIHLSGKIGWFGKKIVMESPDFELLATDEESLHTGRLVPVYNETRGITSKWMRGRIAFLLDTCLPLVKEHLPKEIISDHNLIELAQALEWIHFPKRMEDAGLAKKRLGFDEFLILQLTSQKIRKDWEASVRAKSITTLLTPFYESLPFKLTDDQKLAVGVITADLSKTIPMNRLLVGDVGSGKTVVAAAAIYIAVKNKLKAVLMAPTQILAQQHFTTISNLLSPHAMSVSLITSNSKKNDADVLVGTHALLSKKIDLHNTGLVIIDEQQRFGVEQRQLLRDKSTTRLVPHLLTMTATPIPRTIALVIYGNLDITTIKEMPKGRQKIKTWVVPKEKRGNAYTWIQKELNEHNTQAYIVCPFIDQSETLTTVRAVNKEFKFLQGEIFKTLRLGLLHGRLKPKEKERVLASFRNRELDILVSTPVVEVGIDVANAAIMIIEASERFGLSQLHQLRGRVGRGNAQSYCLLFTEMEEENVVSRLKAMEQVHNGPELSEIDLKLRGPGDVLGSRQHGIPPMKFASFADTVLIEETQLAARRILLHDPHLKSFPLLRDRVEKATIEESISD